MSAQSSDIHSKELLAFLDCKILIYAIRLYLKRKKWMQKDVIHLLKLFISLWNKNLSMYRQNIHDDVRSYKTDVVYAMIFVNIMLKWCFIDCKPIPNQWYKRITREKHLKNSSYTCFEGQTLQIIATKQTNCI